MSLKKYKQRVQKAELTEWHEGRALGYLQYQFAHREIPQDPNDLRRIIQDMLDELHKVFGVDVDDAAIEGAIMTYMKNRTLL